MIAKNTRNDLEKELNESVVVDSNNLTIKYLNNK